MGRRSAASASEPAPSLSSSYPLALDSARSADPLPLVSADPLASPTAAGSRTNLSDSAMATSATTTTIPITAASSFSQSPPPLLSESKADTVSAESPKAGDTEREITPAVDEEDFDTTADALLLADMKNLSASPAAATDLLSAIRIEKRQMYRGTRRGSATPARRTSVSSAGGDAVVDPAIEDGSSGRRRRRLSIVSLGEDPRPSVRRRTLSMSASTGVKQLPASPRTSHSARGDATSHSWAYPQEEQLLSSDRYASFSTNAEEDLSPMKSSALPPYPSSMMVSGRSRLGDVACRVCGKRYKNQICLQKHAWEHHQFWDYTKKLLLNKHQSVQIMEAAQSLMTLVRDVYSSPAALSSPYFSSVASPTATAASDNNENNNT